MYREGEEVRELLLLEHRLPGGEGRKEVDMYGWDMLHTPHCTCQFFMSMLSFLFCCCCCFCCEIPVDCFGRTWSAHGRQSFWFSKVCKHEKIDHWECIVPFLRSVLCPSNRPGLWLLLSIFLRTAAKVILTCTLERLGSWTKLYGGPRMVRITSNSLIPTSAPGSALLLLS